MQEKNKTIGILGGLGPKATAYLLELIIQRTDAPKDQDNIDLFIINRATTPDRTAYIMDSSKQSPLPQILKDISCLEKNEVDAVAIACNTSHYFSKEIKKHLCIPFIDMIEETVKKAKKDHHKKIGIMATTGTITGQIFQKALERENIGFVVPSEEFQTKIMHIIYDNVKANRPVEWNVFQEIIDMFISLECDGIILGCTELSVIKFEHGLGDFYIDSSEALADAIIDFSGKKKKRE